MGIISDLEKISANKVTVYTLLILTLISPGLLFLFLYLRGLFLQLDVIKLIMLSVAISVPILLINVVITGILVINEEAKMESPECKEDSIRTIAKIITGGCITTHFIFGLSVFFKLFLNYDLKRNILLVSIGQASYAARTLLEYGYIKIKIKGKKA